ncbi:MAG: EamA family transporter, partial [Pseudomonadota bacterium]|nr:EamA family transporter [Pseudomonadota bacterium]
FGAVEQFVSLGALAAFGAAFTLGAQFTILKFITDRDSTFILVVGMAAFGSIYLAPFALLNWEPVSWFQLMVFLGMGLLANLGQLGNVMAFRHASASFIAPVKYGGIVMTMLWAFFLLGQVPSLMFWIGAGLITLGGLVLARSRGSAR